MYTHKSKFSILYSKSGCAAIFLVLQCQIDLSHAYPNGAPRSSCKDLLPGHGEQSLTSDVPYEIQLDRVYVRGAGKITITVRSTNPKQYKLTGLMMVVKKPKQSGSAFGTFDPAGSSNDLKTIDCFNKKDSGLTHSSNNPKELLRFQWIAPNTTKGVYELHATLVRDFNSYWVDTLYRRNITVDVDAPALANVISSITTIHFVSLLAVFVLFI